VTGAGRALVERARAVLRDADDLVEAARRAADPFTGSLRIGVIPTISPYLLPAVAPALRAAYPRLTVLWVEDKTHALMQSLAAGTLDAALVALESELGDVESATLAWDPFVLATPVGAALGAGSKPVRAPELRGANVLLLDDGHCFREQALAVCAGARARELEFRATSLPTLAQMVAGGAGVTLLPQLALPTETRGTALRVRRFAEPAPGRTIALVWRRRSPLRPALQQLASTLREAYPDREPARHRGTRRSARR
jgi:LysR family hydrogen peroxide-inducible transcriptional activator